MSSMTTKLLPCVLYITRVDHVRTHSLGQGVLFGNLIVQSPGQLVQSTKTVPLVFRIGQVDKMWLENCLNSADTVPNEDLRIQNDYCKF